MFISSDDYMGDFSDISPIHDTQNQTTTSNPFPWLFFQVYV